MVFGQTKNIKFQVKKGSNRLIFKASNKSAFDQNVTK